MHKNKIVYLAVALAILTAAAGIATSVMAADSDTGRGMFGLLKNGNRGNMTALSEEQKLQTDAVKAALDAGDYDAWVSAVRAIDANSLILGKISAANFTRFSEAHKLIQEGSKIMEELGLERGRGAGGIGIHSGAGCGGVKGMMGAMKGGRNSGSEL